MNETINLDFKGKTRKLRFGIGPSRILCEEKGIPVSDMHTLDINELVQDMIHASLKFDSLLQGLEPDFNKYEVYEWINDMAQETFQKIFEVFIKTRTVGRSIYDTYVENLSKLAQDQGEPQEEKKADLGRLR
jgi:hypothetical protein